MSKPTFFDLLPFQVVQLLIKFCKSLPERYRALLEYWEERRKEKIEDVDDEYDDDEEGMYNSIGFASTYLTHRFICGIALFVG